MKYFRIFLITFLGICPILAHADIYRYEDDEGVVHFSNTPYGNNYSLYLREGAKELPPVDPAVPLRSDWMMKYVDASARNHGLSPALVRAVLKAESNGRRKAVSRKGALGVMQLMPFTSARFNVKDWDDPIHNIEGGVKYLRELLDQFQGNIVYAVAAYNAGPAAVRKFGGIPPYQETRLYVQRVLEYYRKYSSVE